MTVWSLPTRVKQRINYCPYGYEPGVPFCHFCRYACEWTFKFTPIKPYLGTAEEFKKHLGISEQ